MFHLAAFTNTALGTTANTQINALSDQILTIGPSNGFLPSINLSIPAAWAGSPTLLRARLSSPTLRQITQPQIRPVNVAVLPQTDPNFADWLLYPLQVKSGEELVMQATAAPGTTEVFTGLVWLTDNQLLPLPANTQPITIRATSTTAAVANTWTDVTYTLDDQLPNGVYGMLNSECLSTNGIAHRWIFDGMYFRPGHLSGASAGVRQPLWAYQGVLGLMGYFRNTSLPRLQVLVNGTDNAHTIYARITRTGN